MSSLEETEIIEVFDKLPIPYAVIKPDAPAFTILKANKKYQQFFPPDTEMLEGKSFSDIAKNFIVEDNDLNDVNIQADLLEVLKTGEQNRSDIVQLGNKKDSCLFCIFAHSPIRDEDGNLKFIVQSIEDVTDQLASREKSESDTADIGSRSQLQLRNEDLKDQINKRIVQHEATSKELNDFIYSISHDLRAPLRRIDGFSQELMNEYLDQLDDKGAHYLQRVRQGAQDMGDLIDALLKLSRISRRKVEIEEIDVSELVRSIYDDLMELEPGRNIEIEIQDGLYVMADRGLMKSMISNLLSNAIKFTSKEEQAAIEFGMETLNNGKWYFIKDNGVGFDPNYSEKLFKAFDRLHSQKEFKGTGIGLATVKRIVNLHGGTIWAESTPGEGAVFYFNFQRRKA